MERKLASVRKVSEVKPIDGADQIELVIVDGWQCVSKKGEYKEGDKCIYCEIDSFLPIKPEYEFLRKSSYRNVEGLGEGFRIKTIKLRGQLSQGLVIPCNDDFEIGQDVTETLGIIKYDPPVPLQLQGQVKGNFPGFIRKTDQERIQNITDISEISGHSFEVTLKLDGTSFTAYYRDGEIGVCGRNLEYKMDTDSGYKIALMKSGIYDFLKETKKNIAIQGELMGPGIQGNREQLKESQVFIFDVFDIDEQRYLTPDERSSLLPENLVHVPVLMWWTPAHHEIQKETLAMAEETKSINHPVAEGLVFKRQDGQFSFKAISNKFLLKEKD